MSSSGEYCCCTSNTAPSTPIRYLEPNIPAVLRESCVVALDMNDYNASKEFQYANGLVAVKAE